MQKAYTDVEYVSNGDLTKPFALFAQTPCGCVILVNAAGAFAVAFRMFHPEHPHTLGWVALAMAVSCLAMGVLMIGASYAYHRVEKALAREEPAQTGDSTPE